MFKLGPALEDPLNEAPPHATQTWILVTESEILDKSKGDTFGELVIVLQNSSMFGALDRPPAKDTA